MKKINVSYLYLFLPIVFFLFIDFNREIDIWFLLSHGKYVISNGFPHVEFLTIHNGFHFVMQQWGFSVLVYLFYLFCGDFGIIIFIFIINLLIVYFIFKMSMLISSKNIYASCLVTTVADLLLELNFIVPRPQVFSLLLFVALLYLLEKFYENKKYKKIFLIPLISFLLVNFHSSVWLLFFVFSLPYFIDFLLLFIKNKDKRIIKLIIIIVISFLVGFINPYGTEGMFYALSSYGNSTINKLVLEMHSFSLVSGNNTVFMNSLLILLIFLVGIILLIINWKKYSLHMVLLFLGCSFMAFVNLRNMSFLIISIVPIVVATINKKSYLSIRIGIFIVVSLIIFFIFCFRLINNKYSFNNSLEIFKETISVKDTKLYTSFNDGSYFEYFGYKVYIDSRAEVFIKKNNHKDDVFDEYLNVITGDIDYTKFIGKYKFTHLLVDRDSCFYNYLINNDYKILGKYKNKILFLNNSE